MSSDELSPIWEALGFELSNRRHWCGTGTGSGCGLGVRALLENGGRGVATTEEGWESRQMKRALVFGSSGFVGSHLLSELLNSPDYGQVTAVARKSLKITHPRLRTVIADYDSLAGVKSEIAADEVFLALGTTKANSPKKAEYYQVDHDYPVLAARIAKESGANGSFWSQQLAPIPIRNSSTYGPKAKPSETWSHSISSIRISFAPQWS